MIKHKLSQFDNDTPFTRLSFQLNGSALRVSLIKLSMSLGFKDNYPQVSRNVTVRFITNKSSLLSLESIQK